MMHRWVSWSAVGALTLFANAALAQTASSGIYTCVDARGRNLTSDRPIPECTDREQNVLNPSGTVKAKLGPSLTADERAALEAKKKSEIEAWAHIQEEKRRNRALLTRYPNRTVHDKERAEALAQIALVRQAAQTRVAELLRQRVRLDQEMEFYKKDPSKAPASLRRQVNELAQSLAVQHRFIADQDGEINRVNVRFDEELVRLKPLWSLSATLH